MPALALTCGEPSGIAPEITAAAWQALHDQGKYAFFLIGEPQLIASIPVEVITNPEDATKIFSRALPVLPSPMGEVNIGKPSADNGPHVIASIDRAVALTLSGQASGIVTNPIQKESLYQAGFQFEGHTDYLEHLAKQAGHDAHSVMMLAAPGLRTVPITVHIALKDVPLALTREIIESQCRVTAQGLQKHFAIARPRLGITGLNPHAGENGAMGDEEIRIIKPAIEALRAEGLDVTGPLPADTIFHEEARSAYDVIMCMYHDQALIPVKTIGFHEGVNCTLGLPFIRTSPDHGTGLGIAGLGRANPLSLISAIRMAGDMAARGKR